MTTIVSISDEYITLGQFLKHIDVITTGGQAKWYLQEYTVFVDGELENYIRIHVSKYLMKVFLL